MELRSIKYRIYPTKTQQILLEKHFGCCRLLYNLGLECKSFNYSGNKHYSNFYELANSLPELKQEFPFFKEVNSQTLQTSLRNLENAYQRFFTKLGKFPRYKKKVSHQSFQIPQFVTIRNNKLHIPKFKEGIKVTIHKQLDPTTTKIKNATISKSTTG